MLKSISVQPILKLVRSAMLVTVLCGLFSSASAQPTSPKPKDPISSTAFADVCKTTRAFKKNEIYKDSSNLSSHIPKGDSRSGTDSFIGLKGATDPTLSCLTMYDSAGNVLHKMGLYAKGGSYDFRYYGGSGCGQKVSGKKARQKAIQNTTSGDVYLKVSKNLCLGPFNPTKCYNSSKC